MSRLAPLLGSQTVGFVTVTDGALDAFGVPAKVRTTVNVPGCLFRPVPGAESVGDTIVSTEAWRCTARPVAAVLAARVTGELVYDGKTYQITSVDSFPDFNGPNYKVTILCERQVFDPQFIVHVVPRRPTEDPDGNNTFTNMPVILAVFAIDQPAAQRWRGHGERFVQDGIVYVPRGSDLLAGDKLSYNGHTFTVVGNAQDDKPHPYTEDNASWVKYTLAGGG